MSAYIRSLILAILGKATTKRLVPIDRCYHYRGFRYGGFGNNLYEDYIVGLSRNIDVKLLRASFARAILDCRPTTFGEALGIELAGKPAWSFPWEPARRAPKPIIDPADNPDIVCHTCTSGVLVSHINREFGWLEQAFTNIRSRGYLPNQYGYIRCVELVGHDLSSYLITDGNHRLSALHALGVREVFLECVQSSPVMRAEAARWPQVIQGTYTISMALSIFDRYFFPTNNPLKNMHPAKLIADESPLWPIK